GFRIYVSESSNCYLSSVICRLSSVVYRLSTVLAPLHLSRILYKSAPFYAKQTQFPKRPKWT
ncbi:MAG: hypothetical protein ABIL62_15950, partial [Planctomycetota bacterium]